jgi:hypothetical protein
VLRWVIAVLCLVQGAYMAVDGARALVVGSYLTPGSGEHAGELGPWARLVSAVGIPPESTGMKTAFVVFGAAWLIVALGVVVQAGWVWTAGLALAVATLWYLVPGTVISIAVLVLLLTPAGRRALGLE